jgi:hypothetical protein
MSRLAALPLLLVMALLPASCSSDSPVGSTTPTRFTTGSSVSISAQVLASQQKVPDPCPIATPLFVPFLVTVTPGGGVVVVVTSISTQFTDFTGVGMPAVTLPAPIPTAQFGTALDQARNAQTFSLGFCRPLRHGTVAVTVNMRDLSSRTIFVPVN